MLADEDFASPEPSASPVDEDFWRHVDMVFADLTVEDGEEAGNAWWIQRPAGSTEAKMVLRAPSPAGRNLVRSLRAVLSEHESPMVGAKLLVNTALWNGIGRGVPGACGGELRGHAVRSLELDGSASASCLDGQFEPERQCQRARLLTVRLAARVRGWPCTGALFSFCV